jgi:hypothetical protein
VNIMAEWTRTVQNVAVAITVLSGIVMIAYLGVGEVANVVLQPDQVTAATNTSFGGESAPGAGDAISYAERAMVIGLAGVVLGSAGLGLLSTSSSNPRFINDFIRYAPLLLAGVAVITVGSTVWEVIQGNHVWSNDTGADSFLLAQTAAVVAGAMSLLRR